MAGSYSDVPSRRMAWDADGSIAVFIGQSYPDNPPVEYDSSDKAGLNDEGTVAIKYISGTSTDSRSVIIFPELRDIYGVFGYSNSNGLTYCWFSPDTTNGVDGTWNLITSTLGSGVTSTIDDYRTKILTFTPVLAQRAVMVKHVANRNFYTLHVYGEISAGQTPDRLLYVDNSTGLEYTLPIDWGDIPRGAVYDEEWYIKNNSSTLAAVNTTISRESLYLNSAAFYTFSTGVGFADTLGPVASITAGSRWPPSNALTVRCDPPSTATLGLHAARIVLDTSSWS